MTAPHESESKYNGDKENKEENTTLRQKAKKKKKSEIRWLH